MLEIKCSKNYKEFQILNDFNRGISEQHVNSIASDPTFPGNFQYHPIVVNEKFEVIDGQHRLKAAEKIDIPVYYIVHPLANLETIKKCNVQQKKWVFTDYLKFYAGQGFKTYEFVHAMREKFEIPLYLVLAISHRFSGKSDKELSILFKNGEYELDPTIRQSIHEFMDILIPFLKKVKTPLGDQISFIFSHAYFQAFVDIYKKQIDKFEKIINKLSENKSRLFQTSSVPMARQNLLDIPKTQKQYNLDKKKRNEEDIT